MGINLSSLINIFMNMEPEKTYFLNKKTGQVLSFILSNLSKKDMEMLEGIKKDKDSWLSLPKRPNSEYYRDMEEFIPTLNDIKLQERLTTALNSGRYASKSFRDQLRGKNYETEKWNKFQRKKMKSFVISFLRQSGFKI